MEIVDNRLVILPDDLVFKLSEKYFKLFGASCGGEEKILSGDNVSVNEELVSFASGKEFSLLQTSSGKVSYSQNFQSIKHEYTFFVIILFLFNFNKIFTRYCTIVNWAIRIF